MAGALASCAGTRSAAERKRERVGVTREVVVSARLSAAIGAEHPPLTDSQHNTRLPFKEKSGASMTGSEIDFNFMSSRSHGLMALVARPGCRSLSRDYVLPALCAEGAVAGDLAERSEAGLSKGEQSLGVLKKRLRRLRQRVASWANAVTFLRCKHTVTMLTLTYDSTKYTWRPNDIRIFIRGLRWWLGSDLLAYCWVAEVQKRGEVHYHVLVVHTGKMPPKADMSGLWGYGMTRRDRAKKGAFYVMNYAKKMYQKQGLPGGARMFGLYLAPGPISEYIRLSHRMSAWPLWVRALWIYQNDVVAFSPFRPDCKRGGSGIGGWSIGGSLFWYGDSLGDDGCLNGRRYWDWVNIWRSWRGEVRSAVRDSRHSKTRAEDYYAWLSLAGDDCDVYPAADLPIWWEPAYIQGPLSLTCGG